MKHYIELLKPDKNIRIRNVETRYLSLIGICTSYHLTKHSLNDFENAMYEFFKTIRQSKTISQKADFIYNTYGYSFVYVFASYRMYIRIRNKFPVNIEMTIFDKAIEYGYESVNVMKSHLDIISGQEDRINDGITCLQKLALEKHVWDACRLLYTTNRVNKGRYARELYMCSRDVISERKWSWMHVRNLFPIYLQPFGHWKPDPYIHQWVCRQVHEEMFTTLLVMKRLRMDRNFTLIILSYVCTWRNMIQFSWEGYKEQIKHFYC